MAPQPDLADFAPRYQAGQPQVVWTSLVADLETPVSAMLKLAEGRPYSFLFESVEGGAVRGRYSAIGLKPDLIWRCFGDHAEINRIARHDRAAFAPCPGGALESLRGSPCPRGCRRSPPACSASWATTWCA
jgi:anthranilate synthase component 1